MSYKERLLRHAAICFGIMFLCSMALLFFSTARIGFWGHIATWVFGTFFTVIGVSLGDMFRRFVIPDVYFTTGAVDSFMKKIFWMVGPQCIGWIIGYMAFQGFMRNILGYTNF